LAFIWPFFNFQNLPFFETAYGQTWPLKIFLDLATLLLCMALSQHSLDSGFVFLSNPLPFVKWYPFHFPNMCDPILFNTFLLLSSSSLFDICFENLATKEPQLLLMMLKPLKQQHFDWIMVYIVLRSIDIDRLKP